LEQIVKCWTFRLTGGKPVKVRLARTPELQHDGRLTLWQVMMTDKMAAYLEGFLIGQDITVIRHAEVEGPEQKAERDMAASLNEDRVYRTVRCMECIFFHPELPMDCGYEGWQENIITTFMEAHQKAREDIQACPIHGDG